MNEQAALAQAKYDRLQAAIRSLSDDPKFAVFMDEIRSLKDISIREAVMESTVGNTDKRLASLGSVRTYIDIVDIYEAVIGPSA